MRSKSMSRQGRGGVSYQGELEKLERVDVEYRAQYWVSLAALTCLCKRTMSFGLASGVEERT